MSHHIKFLNHSCFIVSSPSINILCDPWFKGTAFGNGWSLLHDDSHDINNLNFDYIWISHEHPDHFSIPTLLELERNQTFLFQETEDKKVKKFLESKGHFVIELKHGEVTKIGDLELTCIVCDGYDSSLLVRYPDKKLLLNINDARIELNDHLSNEIVPLIGDEVLDLLTFQFSYANWAGNLGDAEIPKFLQNEIDEKIEYAISKLQPKALMPFASFVYFSHEENFHWNENNWLDHVFEKYSVSEPTLIFPQPDQSISFNQLASYEYTDSNDIALNFWKEKHQNLRIKDRVKSVTLSNLRDCYLQFNKKLNEKNSLLDLVDGNQNFYLTIKISDLNTTIKVGLVDSFFCEVNDRASVSVSSETAKLLFTQLFARGTITINGRIEFDYDTAHMFFLFFFIPYANNVGIYFSPPQKLTKSMLRSITKTSVMMAIDHVSKGKNTDVEHDISALFDIFDNAKITNTDLEVFNYEPQNEQLN